jgi:hypothetical protein
MRLPPCPFSHLYFLQFLVTGLLITMILQDLRQTRVVATISYMQLWTAEKKQSSNINWADINNTLSYKNGTLWTLTSEQKLGGENIDWIRLARDKNQCQAVVNKVMNLLVPQKAREYGFLCEYKLIKSISFMQLVAEYYKVITNSYIVYICDVSNRLSFGQPKRYPENFFYFFIFAVALRPNASHGLHHSWGF